MVPQGFNFSSLHGSEIAKVEVAVSKGEEIVGYIGAAKSFNFVLNNYRRLAEINALERNWVPAYLHVSNFETVSLSRLQGIFDACKRDVLQELFPIYIGDHFSNGERFSLFRGCAGPHHRKGMSWTSSLDKAIWYAAQHAELSCLENVAVYATVVNRSEIYCCGAHYDYDYVVHPQAWWKIDVPSSEFRLGRSR